MRLFWVSTAACSLAAGAAVIALPEAEPRILTGSVQKELAIAEPAAPAPVAAAPTFDLLHLEKDGSLLVAGRATPDTEVEIVADGDVIGTVRTGATGDFVYTRSGPPRRYELRLRDGKQLSREVAVVAPGDADTGALAFVAAPAKPSRIVQQPQAEAPVAIEAVEVDGTELFVAGAAARPGRVRIYFDGAFVGETDTGQDNRFLLRETRPVPDGRYDVRADLVAADEETVLARAEVPLVHRTGPVAVLEDDPNALRTGASIIIRRGDSLWRISRRAYGFGTRYTTIFEANREQIRDPDMIFAGQVFSLPTDEDDG